VTTSTPSHILTQTLWHLLSVRPVFAQELPILLIRLAGDATFDLRQMNDHVASTALEGVLECLQEFGAQKSNGEWLFQSPPGRRDERVLLRAIRSQLNEVGVTMQAVAEQEAKIAEQKRAEPNQGFSQAGNPQDPEIDRIKDLTSNVVLKYQSMNAELGSQLAALCQSIAQGESISIDGLPDEALKAALADIFKACGLEKSEMADDDDSEKDNDDDGEEEDPTMGYGLPEVGGNTGVRVTKSVAIMFRTPIKIA
jgi:hypothetical protein